MNEYTFFKSNVLDKLLTLPENVTFCKTQAQNQPSERHRWGASCLPQTALGSRRADEQRCHSSAQPPLEATAELSQRGSCRLLLSPAELYVNDEIVVFAPQYVCGNCACYILLNPIKYDSKKGATGSMKTK